MVTYVVTGSSRGIGREFVKQLSDNPDNTVFALSRDWENVPLFQELLLRKNVYGIKSNVVDAKALQSAAEKVAEVTGGSLDVLINNAAFNEPMRPFQGLPDYHGQEDVLVDDLTQTFHINTIGTILVTNTFLPLLEKGQKKQVISLSSALADPDMALEGGIAEFGPYAISKVAMNMAMVKYAAHYKDRGFTFLSLCPGLVDTAYMRPIPPNAAEGNARVAGKYLKVYPDVNIQFQSPEVAIADMIRVFDTLTPETHNGVFMSRKGNKEWLW